MGREGQRGYQPPESQASITKLTDIHSDPRLSGGETERETRLSGGEMERETVIDDNVAEDDTVAMVTSRHDDNESGNESEDEFFEALETHEEEEEDVSVPSTMGEGRTRREREGEGGGEDKEGGEGEMGERWATETLQCHQHSRERGVKGSNVGSDEKEVTPDSAAEPSEEGLGRLEPCGTLVLIATGEPMYIPITQVSQFTAIGQPIHCHRLGNSLPVGRAIHCHRSGNSLPLVSYIIVSVSSRHCANGGGRGVNQGGGNERGQCG